MRRRILISLGPMVCHTVVSSLGSVKIIFDFTERPPPLLSKIQDASPHACRYFLNGFKASLELPNTFGFVLHCCTGTTTMLAIQKTLDCA